jgi:hypothetical protein
VIRSSDGGDTFSVPLFANDACGPPNFRLSALATDLSATATRDRLYFACREKSAGSIVVNSSSDRGETWSTPVVVSPSSPVEERIPALAVNAKGVIAVAWIDGRTAAGHRCEEVVSVAASIDGGQTFSPAKVVSSVSPCADATFVNQPTGGDYLGLTPAPDGKFRLLWSEMHDGDTQLVTNDSVNSVKVPSRRLYLTTSWRLRKIIKA